MLSEPQARFVEAYFSDVGHYARPNLARSAESDGIERTLQEPAVSTVIGAIWGKILEHVAAEGQPIHRLPKQGEKQNGMRVKVRSGGQSV
jgi:hypothetical protein